MQKKKAQLSSLNCATFWTLHVDSGETALLVSDDHLFFTCGQMQRNVFNTLAKSLCHRWLSLFSYMNFSEPSNEDFNHLCICAVDVLECPEWCLRLLRGVSGSC